MQNFNNLLEFIAQWIVGVLLGLLACALLTLLFGCSTPQPVVVERVVVKTDTLYKARTSADTFRLHDSIYVESYMVGDTIYKTKNVFKWRDRVSVKTDTIYKSILRADSIPVPVPVERKATWWERTQMFAGKIAVGAVVLCLISLLLWLIHRRR